MRTEQLNLCYAGKITEWEGAEKDLMKKALNEDVYSVLKATKFKGVKNVEAQRVLAGHHPECEIQVEHVRIKMDVVF